MNQSQTAKDAINAILHDQSLPKGDRVAILHDIETHAKHARHAILLEDRKEKGIENLGEKITREIIQESQGVLRCDFGRLTEDSHCPNAATHQNRPGGLVFCGEHCGEHGEPIGAAERAIVASSRKTKRVG